MVDLRGIHIFVVEMVPSVSYGTIFGFDSDRSRQLCDIFAADYYRGICQDPSKSGTLQFIKTKNNWSELQKDWEGKIRPYAVESKGAEIFGAIGI